MTDAERFSELCKNNAYAPTPLSGDSIGTYKEKRLHRIIKSYISENENNREIPVGKYVADIFDGERVTEIQTGNFNKLLPKLRYYLESTDYGVTVVYPIIRDKMLYRIDKETGEILRKRLSSAHGKLWDALPALYHIRELLPNDRLTVRVLLIDAEEYRYSEAQRYRKEGRYESELFPTSLADDRIISVEDLKAFLPSDKESLTVAEYSAYVKRKGRCVYSALNLLCSLKLLDRTKMGKKYVYRLKNNAIE